MSSISRQQLESWLKTIQVPAGSTLLDIGGSQLPIKTRIQKSEATDYRILDLEQPHECKEKPDIICDLNTGSIVSETAEEVVKNIMYEFDIAFCIEVSEYWWNPIQALTTINTFLKEGGILYISFHFIYPVHNPVDQDYIRYTPRGVEKMLEETGFKILEMKPRLLDTYIANIDGMRPAKSYDKHDWQGCLVKCKKI